MPEAIRRLGELFGDGPRRTVILDAGSSTEASIDWLRNHGNDWITVRRGGADPPDTDPALRSWPRQGTSARAWRTDTVDGGSRLCLWSEARQAKDDAILTKQRERFDDALRALHEGLHKKGSAKRYEKVRQRVGRLKERNKRVSAQFDVSVDRAKSETGQSAAIQPEDASAAGEIGTQPAGTAPSQASPGYGGALESQ